MNLLHYIKGSRKGKDARRFELEAMQDPFLHDAIEGYDAIVGNHVNDIFRIQKNILNKSASKQRFPVWAAAACLILLIGVGTYFLLPQKGPDVFISQEITTPVEKEVEKMQSESILEESSHLADDKVQIQNSVVKPETLIPTKEEREIDFIVHSQAGDAEIISKSEMALLDVITNNQDEELAESKVYVPVPTKPIYDMGTTNSISVRDMQKIESGKIAASKKADDVSKVAQSQASKKLIKGKVVDTQGEPLVGVSVFQKGTKSGAVTDMDGNFTLRIDSVLNNAIALSYVGYEPQEMKINQLDNNPLIAMNENNSSLDEVVVIGYGRTKKKDVSAAMSSVENSSSKKPEPVIGVSAYKNYLKNNVTQPTDEKCATIKGKVVLSFRVNEDGQPYDIQVKKSLCSSADSIAVDLLRNGSKWTYGTQQAEIEVVFKGK